MKFPPLVQLISLQFNAILTYNSGRGSLLTTITPKHFNGCLFRQSPTWHAYIFYSFPVYRLANRYLL